MWFYLKVVFVWGKTVIFIAIVEKQIQQNVVEIYGKLKSCSYFYVAYKDFIWSDFHDIFLHTYDEP